MPLRLLGGVAVRLRAGGPTRRRCDRAYKDLDFVDRGRRCGGGGASCCAASATSPHVAFNAMNAKERMLFFDDAHGRQVDVFVRLIPDVPRDPARRPARGRRADTVPLAELLLTKLQIIELNEKDMRDDVALFARARRHRRRRGDQRHDGSPSSLLQPTGACGGRSRRTWTSVGGHHERYDVDRERIATRLRRAARADRGRPEEVARLEDARQGRRAQALVRACRGRWRGDRAEQKSLDRALR